MVDIVSWNPWWREHQVPDHLHGTPRALTEEILRLDTLRHIKAVVGVRRAGKTTTLRQVIQRLINNGVPPSAIVLVNFDAPDIVEASFEEIERTLLIHAPEATHLVLDEVQQRTGWERWVRTQYDQHRYHRIYITGSSAELLAGELGRLLTGRHIIFQGHPFTFREWWTHSQRPSPETEPPTARQAALLRYLVEGGFPEAVDAPPDARLAVLIDLFHNIVERDVAARHGLHGATAIRLARAFLRDSGKPYSLRRLATATGVSVERAQRHLDHFKETGLLMRVDLFSHKRSPGLRRTAKVYCVDPGLLTAITPRARQETGRLLETTVANALHVLPERDHAVHYFQDHESVECDFILARHGQPTHAIQVAATVRDPATRDRELRGLERASKLLRTPGKLLITLEGKGEEPYTVSADEFLLDPQKVLDIHSEPPL